MMYRVFASPKEDINEGWIWLRQPEVPQRSIVKVTNSGNGNSFYCEALRLEKNFLRFYNQPGSGRISITYPDHSIVINKWYRSRLGDFDTRSDQDLRVTSENHLFGRCWACLHHPQVVVRLSTWLGLLGFVLGIIGLVLGIWTIL